MLYTNDNDKIGKIQKCKIALPVFYRCRALFWSCISPEVLGKSEGLGCVGRRVANHKLELFVRCKSVEFAN